MKVCIAGSRDIKNYALVCAAVEASKFDITEVVSGHATGVDQLGERWALNNDIPVKMFKADWNQYGKSAGVRRNAKMAAYLKTHSGALISIYDGISTGTLDMLDRAQAYGITTFLVVPAIILS